MCKAAGQTGPLYQCSFYGSKDAGAKLAKVLEAGASKSWQETMLGFTGEKGLDATAILEYFQPLKVWLDRQNAGSRSAGKAAARMPAFPFIAPE
jgi:peptidyl-dipeptidase A